MFFSLNFKFLPLQFDIDFIFLTVYSFIESTFNRIHEVCSQFCIVHIKFWAIQLIWTKFFFFCDAIPIEESTQFYNIISTDIWHFSIFYQIKSASGAPIVYQITLNVTRMFMFTVCCEHILRDGSTDILRHSFVSNFNIWLLIKKVFNIKHWQQTQQND